jgi:allantoate deiminase
MNEAGVSPVEVDQSRLAGLLNELSRIGAQSSGGIVRPVYSPAWRSAQDLVSGFMIAAGMEVREDSVGNLFGTVRGSEGSRTVLTGSHIDTVTEGGAFDGALGVVAGIAAIEAAVQAAGPPRRTVEIVSLCEEEGSRFHSNFLGTRAILGMLEPGEADHLLDAEGVSLADAARSVGLVPEDFGSASRDDLELFLELHIEQGRVLVDSGVDVGIVDVITGLTWLDIQVDGRADHAGATAMTDRLDAFQGAARMAIAAEEVALEQGPPAVATTGAVRVYPGGANIVPARAEFTIDVRHPDQPTLDELVRTITDHCQRIAATRGLEVSTDIVKRTPASRLDQHLRTLLENSSKACGTTHRIMPSGAGHDSQTMATRIPAAMVFVPSVDGRSHSPAEYSTPESCARGASVLATALRSIAW